MIDSHSCAEATAFGLDIRSAPPLELLASARAPRTGRTLAVSRIEGGAVELGWPAEAKCICRQSRPGGSDYFRIESHPLAGYLLWSEDFGSYLLSPDGHRLQCAPSGCPSLRWERFLIGQVLPFAALLQGLEVFHASAVVVDGCALAFVGPSGAGKTSVALECCRRRASFLADDVLALEPRAHDLLAQPGAPMAARKPAAGRRGELLERLDGGSAPVPVGSLFFLDRRRDGPSEPCFEPAADARALLASTFNFVLDTPRRILGLLDVCALAARRPVRRVVIGSSVTAAAVADAVLSQQTVTA